MGTREAAAGLQLRPAGCGCAAAPACTDTASSHLRGTGTEALRRARGLRGAFTPRFFPSSSVDNFNKGHFRRTCVFKDSGSEPEEPCAGRGVMECIYRLTVCADACAACCFSVWGK